MISRGGSTGAAAGVKCNDASEACPRSTLLTGTSDTGDGDDDCATDGRTTGRGAGATEYGRVTFMSERSSWAVPAARTMPAITAAPSETPPAMPTVLASN